MEAIALKIAEETITLFLLNFAFNLFVYIANKGANRKGALFIITIICILSLSDQ
jgi:hypothetical protein